MIFIKESQKAPASISSNRLWTGESSYRDDGVDVVSLLLKGSWNEDRFHGPHLIAPQIPRINRLNEVWAYRRIGA